MTRVNFNQILISILFFLLFVCAEGYKNKNIIKSSKFSSVKENESNNLSNKRTNKQSEEHAENSEEHPMSQLEIKYKQFTEATNYIVQFLRTDGKFTPPSGGISWIAIAATFSLLSPMAIPLILCPLVLFYGYFLFLAYEISRNNEQVEDHVGRFLVQS